VDVETAVLKFYEFNGIKKEDYVANYSEQKRGQYIDRQITYNVLKNNIDKWISIFSLDDEKIVFLKLLSKFRYFTSYEYERCVAIRLEDSIKEVQRMGGKTKDILFVTCESKKGAFSGGASLSNAMIKCLLQDFDDEQISSGFSRYESTTISKYSYYIFIDDIIGTGFTTMNSISSFLKKFPNAKKGRILYTSIIATKRALKFIEKRAIQDSLSLCLVSKPIILDKVFSSEIIGLMKNQDMAIMTIKKYENMIDGSDKEKYPYALGFEKSKQLVSFYYNTPNNTLCCFWKEGSENKPPFRRGKRRHTRLGIDELKQKKYINCTQSYEMEGENIETT